MDGMEHHDQPMQQVPQGAPYSGYPNGQYPQYAVPNNGAPAAAYPGPDPIKKPAASPSGGSRTAVVGLVITVAVLAAAIIGLAAGLGVSQKNLHDTQDNLNAALASLSTAAPATRTLVVTGTKTSSPAAATATATTTTTDIYSQCPSANNTIYGTSTQNFTVRCGIDYSGTGEADDLDSSDADSMSDCMDDCLKNSKCEGAGWGHIDGAGKCYMKANLTKYHTADSNWEFAVLNTANSTSS